MYYLEIANPNTFFPEYKALSDNNLRKVSNNLVNRHILSYYSYKYFHHDSYIGA